jgi:triphosphatase
MSGDQPEQTAHSAAAPDHAPGTPAEIEIKFRADRPGLHALLAAPALQGAAIGPPRELLSTYYDTPGLDLQRNGLTLRVRRKGRSIPLLGVKWTDAAAGDLFARGEIETPSPHGEPDIALLEPAIRDRLTQVVGSHTLAPVFKTNIKRRTLAVRHGRSEIELALDDGIVIANDQSLPITEAELELKQGSVADLLSLARALAEACKLSLAFESKSARGYRLAMAATPGPQKARPLQLPQASSFDDAIATVLSGCLAHFTANWNALRASDAPDSIHQLRVALRRLRSALRIFGRRITMPELDDFRARARHIASSLGPARECDVFRQNALAGPLRDQPQRLAAATRLLDAVENRRRESYAEARRIIDDPATSLFVLDLQSFLTQRCWRTALGADEMGLLTSPARDFAGEVLDRLRRRALKRGRHLPDMPDVERHELRIALKNLRYAAEFFGSLFEDDKASRKFLRFVAELQEDLGAHNDAATAEAFVTTLDIEHDAQARFAAGYLLGFYRHASLVADTHLTRKWKNFRHADVGW